jgi:Dehydrogenases with different specificities (related to short-chain alcohol dehydrogenases)
MGDLTDQTAIVTGASRGIGNAIAERFAQEGANVVVNSRSTERAEAAAADISGHGDTVGIAADVSNYEEVESLVDGAVRQFGSVDIMVNNAGITNIGPAEEFDPEEWREVIDVDLNGVFFGSQAASRQMIDQDSGGAILNISSIMGEMGYHMRAPYCAAKGAVNNLTRTLAVEWADHDISVNALAPGFIYTDIVEQTQDSAGYTDEDIQKRTPMDRYGSLDEMTECALFLVSGENYVTGEVLTADGGFSADAWRYRQDRGESSARK